MGRPINIRINRAEFDTTINRYADLSSRDPKTICDTKGFFIARRAVIETPKADKGKIRSELGRVVVKSKKVVSMNLRTVKRYGRFGQEEQAPLVALIINARRKGKKGLYGQAMAEAIRKLIGARNSSIAFIKSGWLQAIKTLEQFADRRGAPRTERGPQQIGAPKGFAVPATGRFVARTTIANTASTKRDHKQALFKYGEPALQRAFDAETASMLEYMERKLKETATKAGVKHK